MRNLIPISLENKHRACKDTIDFAFTTHLNANKGWRMGAFLSHTQDMF